MDNSYFTVFTSFSLKYTHDNNCNITDNTIRTTDTINAWYDVPYCTACMSTAVILAGMIDECF